MPEPITPFSVPWQSMNLAGRVDKTKEALNGEKLSAGKNAQDLKNASIELESLFVYQLLKVLRDTVPKSGFISGGKAEELYTSMLDIHLAKDLSRKGEIGLSSIVVDQLGGKSASDGTKSVKR